MQRYQDLPKLYTWNNTEKKWTERKNNSGTFVGRMYYIAPCSGEQFYLRLLLHYFESPKSFADLRLYNGYQYDKFHAAAIEKGLLQSDT